MLAAVGGKFSFPKSGKAALRESNFKSVPITITQVIEIRHRIRAKSPVSWAEAFSPVQGGPHPACVTVWPSPEYAAVQEARNIALLFFTNTLQNDQFSILLHSHFDILQLALLPEGYRDIPHLDLSH